jgi:hypothetical protein
MKSNKNGQSNKTLASLLCVADFNCGHKFVSLPYLFPTELKAVLFHLRDLPSAALPLAIYRSSGDALADACHKPSSLV